MPGLLGSTYAYFPGNMQNAQVSILPVTYIISYCKQTNVCIYIKKNLKHCVSVAFLGAGIEKKHRGGRISSPQKK